MDESMTIEPAGVDEPVASGQPADGNPADANPADGNPADGNPADGNPAEDVNVASIIDPHPAEHVALISRGKTTTYGELRDQVGRLRAAFIGLGMQPGDRLALLCANNWYFVVSYLAGLSAGLIVVPLNPQSPRPELEGELRVIDARAVVVGPTARATFVALDLAQLPSLQCVIDCGADAAPGHLRLDELMAASAASPVSPPVARSRDDDAVLMFTSGTAGTPKAAMLTHGNLLANLDQARGHGSRPDDVALGVLPLFHIFGLNVALGATLYAGARIVLIERFDPASAATSIARWGVTVIAGPPNMWASFAALPDVTPEQFRTVRLAVSGAAGLPDTTRRAVRERLGLELAEGYGLTETAPTVTSSVGGGIRPGSIGRPARGVAVRLVDEDGDDVEPGDPGEIWVRGPNVFRGYWNDPTASAAALTADGWLRTGDVAVADEDGYLYLVDRIKDLIIVSGFNVYPAEVEEVLVEHPGVAAAAVVGVPHPHTGDAVKAFVVPVDGASLEEDEIIAFCSSRLARYKCPSKIEFVDAIPQSASGKVARRELRAT
jgi:long-chain acyl-CoA synthetase